MSSRFSNMSEELFQILKGSGKVLTLYDAQGRKVYEPASARKFFAEPDKMMLSINEADSDSSINLYLSQTADIQKIAPLINTLRAMSSRYNVILDVKKYGKELSPKDFAYQTIGETSMWGSTKTSYQRIGEAKLIVRHCSPVSEDIMGSRARNILSLFVETRQGERFKFPVCHLSGARAWAYHISEGGLPHDDMGLYVVEQSQLASDITKLTRYVYYAKGNLAEEAQIVRNQLRNKVLEIRKGLQSLSRSRGYSRALDAKVFENVTTIKEGRQLAIESECQRLRELLDIDSNHALAETILPAALITLGDNMTTDTTKFGQILALESVDELIECFASEYGFEEGTHWARHDMGLMLLPEAVTAAEDYLGLIDEGFELYENSGDAYEQFATNWFATRKANSGAEGESPDDRDESKSARKIEDLAQGLRDIQAGRPVANVELPAEMPGFADKLTEFRFKLGLYLEARAAMQNDALWTFISTIVDKLQDGQKLSQIESIFAGKLVAALDHVKEGVGEQDDVLEVNDPTSFEAGAREDKAESAEGEIISEFPTYLMDDFLRAHYPFFNGPCDQEEPMSTHDVMGDLTGFLNAELNQRMDSDGFEVFPSTAEDAMVHVMKVAQDNGWTFDKPISESANEAIAMGDTVATDYGPGEVLEVEGLVAKVQLQHGGIKELPVADLEKVEAMPKIKELAEMMAWFEQFDPQSILSSPITEADVDAEGFNSIVCNAFKDGESVSTISKWSLVAPDLIEDILMKNGLLDQQMAAENVEEADLGAAVPLYFSDGMNNANAFIDKAGKHYGEDIRDAAMQVVDGEYYVNIDQKILKHLLGLAQSLGEKPLANSIKDFFRSEAMRESIEHITNAITGHDLNEAVAMKGVSIEDILSELQEYAKKVLANPAEYGISEPVGYDDMDEQMMEFKDAFLDRLFTQLGSMMREPEVEFEPIYGEEVIPGDKGDDFENDVKRPDLEDTDNSLVGDLATLRHLAGVKK